jgi:hypothetical protein
MRFPQFDGMAFQPGHLLRCRRAVFQVAMAISAIFSRLRFPSLILSHLALLAT